MSGMSEKEIEVQEALDLFIKLGALGRERFSSLLVDHSLNMDAGFKSQLLFDMSEKLDDRDLSEGIYGGGN